MVPRHTAACILSLAIFGVSRTLASDFAIEMKANGDVVAEILLRIEGNFATATVAGEAERFNLKEMSWLDERTNQWVTAAQCKEWSEQSKAKSLQSTVTAPARVRSFVMWSLDPTFRVEKSNGTLRLTSGHVDYVIEGEASMTGVDGYYRYAIVNAYKKAIVEKKLPPFSELKAIEEMKALGYVPRKISIAIPAIQGSPTFEIQIAESKP
jgi:hypothetical protein